MPNFSKTHKFFLLTTCIYLMFAVALSRFGPSWQIPHSIHADSARIYPPGEVILDPFGSPWDSSRFNPFITNFDLCFGLHVYDLLNRKGNYLVVSQS